MAKRLSREKRREQIAEAGLRIAAEGLPAITVERVAAEVGVVPSALYRHFRDKDAILDAVLDLIRTRILGNAADAMAEGRNALDALRLLQKRQVAFVGEHPGMLKAMFSGEFFASSPARLERARVMQRNFIQAVVSMMERGQDERLLRTDVPAEDLAFNFLGTILPALFVRHVQGEAFDVAERGEKSWKLFEKTVRYHACFEGGEA